jgi:DNA-binding SARP family transcriptional activator/tetratricopeptide (TPR) repeat protein
VLRLWLCGRLAAEFDGVRLAMPTSERAQALLGFLALHPGPHPRTELAALLWPDHSGAKARASLRTAIWSLRQAWGSVGERVLSGSRTAFGLRDDGLWVDALADRPLESSAAVLLPGIDDEWAREARDEFRAQQLGLLTLLAVSADDEGRHADALAWSRQRCVLAPLDETAHRDLLRRLDASGDRAGALVVAKQFSQRLRDELGVTPSPLTRAAQAELQGQSQRAAHPQLFGRSGELAALTAAWRAAAAGAGQIVVLTGEAGIGKTSLVTELAHRVAAGGGRTAIGAGIDVGGETPFAAWLELARALVPTVAPVPTSVGWPSELNRLSEQLGAALGRNDAPAAVAAPELERLRVFESVLRLVEWSCADRPALIAFEDAHRADRASLRLTAHIGRRIAALPLLLVLTRRDRPSRPELDALLGDLTARAVPITEIEIGPIGDRDVAALASSLLRLDDDAVRRVVAAAEGNPLLAVESTRALAAGSTAPPPNLRTAVRGALAALPPPARLLASLLAVAGRPLARAELDALGVPDLRAGEQAGTDSGLLVRLDSRLGYRHALLRASAYADLSDPTPLHDQLAAALDPGDSAEIAYHLNRAGRAMDAARQWAAAAEYARSVGALAEAAEFLRRAIECTADDGQLWLELQEVCAWQGQRDAMERAWEHALTLLPPQELPWAWCRRGRQLRSVMCHPEASFASYKQAEAFLGPDSSPTVRAYVLVGLAWGEAVAGDAGAAEGLLTLAASVLPAVSDPEVTSDIAEIRILGLIRQGRFAECAKIANAAGPFAPSGHLPARAFAVWINAACALACAEDHAGALELADRAVEATAAVPVLLVGCLAAQAQLLARLGRHDEAAFAAQRQRDCAERLDSPALAATAAHDAGLVALAAKRYREAADLLGTALAEGAEVSRPAAGLARAEALARAGDLDAAATQVRAVALEPVGPADQPWALVPRMAAVQALIAAGRGDVQDALDRFDEAAQGWQGLLASVTTANSEGYFANLVDLGRPPVIGLVEPARELALIEHERTALGATYAGQR